MNDFIATLPRPGREEQALERKFILIIALQLLLLSLLPQHALGQPEPDNRLEVLLRTLSGDPIAGVTVTLAPREAALGGPTNDQAARSGATNSGGWVAFDRVSPGIWLLSFAGSADGAPMQAAADQGRPPYGTTTAGGGFTVAVNGTTGDDIKLEDAPLSGVQQAIFTGKEHDGTWVPEYDLSDPNLTPAPLSLVQLVVEASATAVRTNTDVGVSATTEDAATASATQLAPVWLCYVPVLLLGLVLFGRTLLRRHRAVEERS